MLELLVLEALLETALLGLMVLLVLAWRTLGDELAFTRLHLQATQSKRAFFFAIAAVIVFLVGEGLKIYDALNPEAVTGLSDYFDVAAVAFLVLAVSAIYAAIRLQGGARAPLESR